MVTASDLDDLYTLNFKHFHVAFVSYFLGLFPVFVLSANFPILAITLRNNVKTLLTRLGITLSPRFERVRLSHTHSKSHVVLAPSPTRCPVTHPFACLCVPFPLNGRFFYFSVCPSCGRTRAFLHGRLSHGQRGQSREHYRILRYG